jgi:SPP1 family predicted phage head-tail adaptor
MRHRVVIQRRKAGTDAAGGPLSGWEEFASRAASVDRASGSEVWESAQRNARVPVVFRLRYLPGVTPGMRLLFGGKAHNITSAVDLEARKAELVITAEELVEETI